MRSLEMPWMSKGMRGRLALVLAIAILLELLGNLALHRWQERELLGSAGAMLVAQQLVDAAHVAEAASRSERAGLMHGLAIDGLALNWVPSTVITDHSTARRQLANMRERLVRFAPELEGRELRLSLMPGTDTRQRDLVGLLALNDGSFISFRVNRYLQAPPPLWLVSLLHIVLLASVFGLALLMIQTMVRPLRRLATAADETGRDYTRPIDVPKGPQEVTRLADALAGMQARLLKVMRDNTQALIAVSHDLRTPIQRMKLRVSMSDDAELREAMGQDMAEMEIFIDGMLAYVRSGADEQARLIDAAAVLTTIVDDMADMGTDIRFIGPDSLTMSVRPIAFTRMIQNLIENARRYANRIEVRLTVDESGGATIAIEDDGPGIPEERRQEALRPFHKLDSPSQGPSPGQGAGLGLAFVERTLELHSGKLRLDKSDLGGLSVRIGLPGAQLADAT